MLPSSRFLFRQPSALPPASTPPTDGPKAWSVALGSFLVGFCTMGLMYSQGIFIEPLLAEFGESLALTSLVATLCPAAFYACGMFTGPVAMRVGIKRYTALGGALWIAGCLLGSVSPNIYVSIITQGILTGLGTGMTYWVTLAIMPAWFSKYRSTGLGLGVLGSGVGSIAVSIGGGELIQSLGWRRTLQVFGAVGAAMLFVAVLLLEQRLPPRKVDGFYTMTFRLAKVRSYQLFVLSFAFWQVAFLIPFTFLPHYSIALGFDSTFSAFTLAMIGIGSSIGRIVFGPIADIFHLRLFIFKSTIFLAAVCLWIWPWCTTESSILAFAFFYGLVGGCFFAMFGVVAAELWGPANVGATFPLCNLVGIPGSFGSAPIFAAIVTATSTFEYAIFFAASMLTVSFLFMALIRFNGEIDPSLLPSPAVTPMTTSLPTVSSWHSQERAGQAKEGNPSVSAA